MIVDMHCHILRYPDHYSREVYTKVMPRRVREAWAKRSEEEMKRSLDAPPEPYIREMDRAGVGKALLLPTKLPLYGQSVPNEYVRDLAQQYPDKFAWACSVLPFADGAAEEVERCVKQGAVAVGEIASGYQQFRPNDERCYPVWRKAQELGVPVVFHAGPSEPSNLRIIPHGHVLFFDDLAIAFPEVKWIICHFGWPHYHDCVFLLQKHDNVYADLSWIYKAAGLDRLTMANYMPVVHNPYWDWVEPLAYYFSRTWGHVTDKLVAGSDWPTCKPTTMVSEIRNLNILFRKYNFPEVPQQSLENILSENWKKLIKL